jgi:hypothetical protein
MLQILLHLLAAIGPAAIWIAIFFAVVVAAFVVFVGIAMGAVLRAEDPEQQSIRYKMFRDLLGLFRDALKLLLLRRRR